MRASPAVPATRSLGTRSRRPPARNRPRRRACIRGNAAAPAVAAAFTRWPYLTTTCRTTGAAGFEPATSRVSGDAALDRLAEPDVQAARPAESGLTASSGQGAAPAVSDKVPANRRFFGWARLVSNQRPLACEAWRSRGTQATKYLQISPNRRDRRCPALGLIRPNTAGFGPTNGPTASSTTTSRGAGLCSRRSSP
jgi:hypothetical protein